MQVDQRGVHRPCRHITVNGLVQLMWGQEQAEQNTLTSCWINNIQSSIIIIISIILTTLSSVFKYDRKFLTGTAPVQKQHLHAFVTKE